jgi:hypothetical protein
MSPRPPWRDYAELDPPRTLEGWIVITGLGSITAALFELWLACVALCVVAFILAVWNVWRLGRIESSVEVHPSQLRARQLDHIARRDRIR